MSIWQNPTDGSLHDDMGDVGLVSCFTANGFALLTDDEVAAARAPTAAQLWANYQAQAQASLDKSDVTILRCAENGVAVPAAWATYRADLRAITGAKTAGDPTQSLPGVPAYPAGT
jgi:hypothetical protein